MSAASAARTGAVSVFIDGIGMVGPGFDDWEQGRELLLGAAPHSGARTRLPPPESLPAAERRRAGLTVKAALAVGRQALLATGLSPARLPTVFASSGGDSVNCHEICAALASADRVISPTRFHNSVHNAPSGYWSISSGAMATSSVVCAHDGSFAAGLLEAMVQAVTERQPVLLLAYDTDYPQPLHAVRPISDTMAVGLLLSPQAGPHSLGQLTLQGDAGFTGDAADTMDDPALERIRTGFPAARGLPLLAALARGQRQPVVIAYLPGLQLALQAAPC